MAEEDEDDEEDEELEMDAMMSQPAPIEAQEEFAQVESADQGATVEFSLPHSLSIPGDGGNHRVAIATRELPTKFEWVAMPRVASVAYLRAKATNDSALNLLPGQASIFRDGVFVGKAPLKNTAPGGELELFLGPDEQVRASRELTTRETDKNFIGNAKRVHFAYEIELENLKQEQIALEVRDQIPVSRSETSKSNCAAPRPKLNKAIWASWNGQFNSRPKRSGHCVSITAWKLRATRLLSGWQTEVSCGLRVVGMPKSYSPKILTTHNP